MTRPRRSQHGKRAAAFSALAAIGLLGCRAVLGIEERPLESGSDGGGDATSVDVLDADAGGPRYCETITPRPIFCSDFDRGELLSEWMPVASSGTNPHVLAGGVVEPDAVQVRSGPRSARFGSLALTSPSATATAFAAVDLPSVPAFLFLEVELRVDTELFVPDGGAVDILELELPGSGAIRIARSEGETRLVVADFLLGTEQSAPFALPFPVGQWVQLKVLLHNALGELGDVGAYLGATAAKLSTPSSFQRNLGKEPILRAGVVVAKSPVGAFRVNIDNLRISYEP